ncbi:hypothetical protein BDF20DRAFT_840122 [Mycotypha africana]|uniref:uncharacterized protein n=1 Tax=Mycotypha africana TaxID=64632 RepID=UPI0023016142|nr:uncharacterized protein BDF20DRAFT_840122 [Mycotypha africana]KAI8967571.1 hypothetical protein BDF20DRAFT_840122 [Mycotypha africana]
MPPTQKSTLWHALIVNERIFLLTLSAASNVSWKGNVPNEASLNRLLLVEKPKEKMKQSEDNVAVIKCIGAYPTATVVKVIKHSLKQFNIHKILRGIVCTFLRDERKFSVEKRLSALLKVAIQQSLRSNTIEFVN